MSAIGTKRTSQPNRLMSAIGGKADIAAQAPNVRFDPKWTSSRLLMFSHWRGP